MTDLRALPLQPIGSLLFEHLHPRCFLRDVRHRRLPCPVAVRLLPQRARLCARIRHSCFRHGRSSVRPLLYCRSGRHPSGSEECVPQVGGFEESDCDGPAQWRVKEREKSEGCAADAGIASFGGVRGLFMCMSVLSSGVQAEGMACAFIRVNICWQRCIRFKAGIKGGGLFVSMYFICTTWNDERVPSIIPKAIMEAMDLLVLSYPVTPSGGCSPCARHLDRQVFSAPHALWLWKPHIVQ